MRKACFCYTTDKNYMGATVLSALQARRHATERRADVLILLLGPDDAEARGFAAVCAQHGIFFRCIDSRELEDLPVPFGRHFLHRFVSPDYTDIVHIDGDTQVVGSLDPLLDLPLPAGRVLAVPDPMAVMIHHPSPSWRARRAYFRSIGIPEDRLDRYFNSGVFRVNRGDAEAMGRECVRQWRKLGDALRFSEQDAFNIAFGGVVDLISFRWNFPVFFLNGGIDAAVPPHIIHFMSNPRPWQGGFAPWGRPAHQVYVELAATHPELAAALKPLSGLQAVKYTVQQHAKRLVERRIWTRPPVRERISRFEREAAL